jgi:annexin-like protein
VIRRAQAAQVRQASLDPRALWSVASTGVSNAALARLVRPASPTHGRLLQRVPALAPHDYAALVEQLHDAMAGWGTDEEAIYASLRKLEKDPTAIAALKKAYKDAYKEDLEDELRSEMSGSELDLALELLGAGGAATPMIGAVPVTPADMKAAAKRLHEAMAGWGTDEEAIYAALIPFNHDAAKLTTLKTTYKTDYGSELEADIKDEMSSDELAYALYLLNAPPSAAPAKTTTVNAPGTEQHAGKVPGGDVSLHTGATMTIGGGGPLADSFSVGYQGGLSADTRWVQFIWSEIVATQADGSDAHVAASGLGTSNGKMDLTTDPSSPRYKVDSESTSKTPFYEEGFVSIRTPTATTIYDRPEAFSDVIEKQFDAGATKVIERDHFDHFLVRDYKTIYHTSLYVEWVYTSKVAVARTTHPGPGGKVTEMPGAFRDQMIKEYPRFEYIR